MLLANGCSMGCPLKGIADFAAARSGMLDLPIPHNNAPSYIRLSKLCDKIDYQTVGL
jgi:hypothetical protein